MTKPFSQACENNKRPIAQVLKQAFAGAGSVLEIGSGTGQHAVFMARQLPHVHWQTSDQPQYHAGIHQWLADEPSPNLLSPLTYQVGVDACPVSAVDGVFTANTAHIMQRHEVQQMMQDVQQVLPEAGVFCQYGPFTRSGEFSSQSNQDFHQQLLAQGYGGYRDISELESWAGSLSLVRIHTMPANNLLLEWHKQAG